MMKISVVIPTKNRLEDLIRCLNSLIDQTISIDELIIIDASTDNATNFFFENSKNMNYKIHHIYQKQINGGLAKARNLGNSLANGDIIFQIEDDIVLDKNYVKCILFEFLKDKEKQIGGISGIESSNGSKYQKLYGIFYYFFGLFFLRDYWKRGHFTISGHPTRLPKKYGYVEWMFNGAYRKEIAKEFTYDEKLEKLSPFAYYDDVDFSYQVSKKYKLIVTPKAMFSHSSAQTQHFHSGSFKTNCIKIFNHYYLVKKHGFKEIAFWWSHFGLFAAHFILLIFQPKENNYLALKGLIRGFKLVLSSKHDKKLNSNV